MKNLIIFIVLITSLFSKELHVDEVNQDTYSIQIATLTSETGVKRVLKSLNKYSTFVSKSDKFLTIYVVNLATYVKAKEELQNIKKQYPTAIIRKLTNLKNQDEKTIIIKADDFNNTQDDSNLTVETIVEPLLIKADDINDTISLNEDELFKSDRFIGFTLYQSIIHSLNHNYKVKASNERIYQTRKKIEEKEAGHLPTIDLSGNAGVESRKIESGDIKSGPTTTTKMDYHKTELYLTIKENLWTGGKIQGAIDEQEYKLEASLYDHRNEIEKATINIINAYFGVVYAEIAVKISEHNMKSYEKILNIVTIKEENGASTKGDVNFIQANVDNAKTSLINDQAKLSNEMAKYNYYMQEVNEENLPYETETTLKTKDLNASINYMYDNNAILLRQEAYINSSLEAIKVKKGNYHPVVDFVINGETRDEFNTGIGKRDKANALITFSYNLYRGGKDEAAYLRVYSKMSEQKYLYTDEKSKLIFDIKVLHRSTLSMNESLALTANEVKAARKVVDSYWIAFKHGTQDLQALQLAQRNLNRAQLDYINYKKTFIINNFKLMQKTGELLKFLEINQNDI